MLQHGKSVKRTSSSARSVGVEVLVLFLKIMLKSVIIRNSFSSVVGVSRGKRGRGFRAGGLEHTSDYYYCVRCYSGYHYYHYIIRWTCTHTRELASTKSPWKVMMVIMTHKFKFSIHRRHQLIRTKNHFHQSEIQWSLSMTRTQHCVNIVTGLPSLSLTTTWSRPFSWWWWWWQWWGFGFEILFQLLLRTTWRFRRPRPSSRTWRSTW